MKIMMKMKLEEEAAENKADRGDDASLGSVAGGYSRAARHPNQVKISISYDIMNPLVK